MGGKDTPPPCVSGSPMQGRGYLAEKARSFSMSSAASSSSSLSSSSTLTTAPQASPIRYVPPCRTRVNLKLQCPSPSVTRVDRAGSIPAGESLDSKDPAAFSPIRAYIDCLAPQTLKCAIVGDSGVGKTSMLMSYVVDKFPETHSPTIYDKFSSSITVNGRRISVTLCDTAGQDDFAHLRPLCYPQVDVALICYSVVDHASFDSVKSKWMREVHRHCPGVPIILVGTQTDQRVDTTVIKRLKSQGKKPLTKADGNKLASQCKAACYLECSALTQQNVKQTFDEAIATGLEMNNGSSKHTPQCAGCTIL